MNILDLPFWDFFKKMHEDKYHYLKFETTDYWFYAIISLLFFALCLFTLWMIAGWIYNDLDKRKSTTHKLLGELIDKKYIGEQHSSGTGTAIIPNTSGGVGVGVISTSSTTDENFLFFVRDTKVYKIEVDMQDYYSRNIGDKIAFEVKVGGLSKEDLNVKLS